MKNIQIGSKMVKGDKKDVNSVWPPTDNSFSW